MLDAIIQYRHDDAFPGVTKTPRTDHVHVVATSSSVVILAAKRHTVQMLRTFLSFKILL